MRWLLAVLSLVAGVALAQDYSGSYTAEGPSGLLTLVLQQDAQNNLNGTLSGPDLHFELEGFVYPEDQVAAGVIYTAEGVAGFEAYLQGETLGLYLVELDANNNPIVETATELIMTRQAAATAPPVGTENPLAEGMPPSTSLGDGEPAQVGRRYPAGTRIIAPWSGVAFTVPEEYYAGFAPQQNAFLLVSDTQPGLIAVAAFSQARLDDLLGDMSAGLQSEELTLIPQGQPQQNGSRLSGLYTAMTPQGQGFMYLLAQAGEAGNVLLLTVLGATHEQQQLQALLEGMMASASFARPDLSQAAQWQERLAGQAFRAGSYTSSNSYDDSAFSESEISLDLCSDGTYAYVSSYFFSASVPGVSAMDQDRDEHQGRWQLAFGLLGPMLVLDSTAGERLYLSVLESGGSFYIEGKPVQLAPSARCP